MSPLDQLVCEIDCLGPEPMNVGWSLFWFAVACIGIIYLLVRKGK